MIKYKNEMEDYLYNHNYVSENKKSNYQQELSIERAECIINKYDNIVKQEKQQLIKFLEDKIKQSKDKICKIRKTTNDGWEISILKRKIVDFQEILDFVNKGGKDE